MSATSSTSSSASSSAFAAAQKTVVAKLDEMHALKNNYTLDSASKMAQLEALLKDVEASISALASPPPAAKAEILYWRGRALDAFPEYSPLAEQSLSKAVKLNPALIDAWNCLGDTYWKKKAYEAAKNCFVAAIKQKKNKVSLRQLSLVLRAMCSEATDNELISGLYKESLQHAKDAVALDILDGSSWYILGNAYMTRYFGVSRDARELASALKAYQRAEVSKVDANSSNPDLYFNRGSIHEFLEDYAAAVKDLMRAHALDPSLQALSKVRDIERKVERISNLCKSKCGIKSKRLVNCVAKLEMPPQVTTTKKGKVRKKRDAVTRKALSAGENPGVAFVCKVLAPASRDSDTPTSFIVIDKDSAVMVLSLYNVTASVMDLIKVDDELIVLDPVVKSISYVKGTADAKYNDEKEQSSGGRKKQQPSGKVLSYTSISVDNPVTLMVNKRSLPRNVIALPQVSVESFT